MKLKICGIVELMQYSELFLKEWEIIVPVPSHFPTLQPALPKIHHLTSLIYLLIIPSFCFPTTLFYAFLGSLILATFLAHQSFIDFNIISQLGDLYES
jgi:hypothetical protein